MRQKHGSLRKRREALARTNREFIRLGSKNNAYERGETRIVHLDKVEKDIKELNSKGMKLKEIILEIISTSITITYMDDKSCYKKLLAKGGKETLRRISKDIFYKYYKDYKVTIIE